MGSFVLARMSFRNLFKKPATRLYPVVASVVTPMTKGHIVNDIEACILCGICAKKCPSLALAVDRAAGTWIIDPYACIQCYTCVRTCPKDSLTMLAQYTPASVTMASQTLVKPEAEAETEVGAEVGTPLKTE
ncbi:MAG: 4Fe-4S binding protein [Coriobacteriales bacterium]|jgi:formate hydrogenlyase subunit 6/NADH:ubiquinone oxidoreductase subunit I|nr:4Fe-4S binding protein [Coriobacteriales bacterium]